MVTTAWKNLHYGLSTLYLSYVDKTKLSFSRTVTIKFTHAREIKQSFIRSTDYMNAQFYCTYLMWQVMYAHTLKCVAEIFWAAHTYDFICNLREWIWSCNIALKNFNHSSFKVCERLYFCPLKAYTLSDTLMRVKWQFLIHTGSS